MKKIFFLISIAFLLLQSCSSEDSSISKDNNNSSTTVSDVDGNVYSIVKICNQNWIKTNLNVTKYRNGDVIPQVTDADQWAALETGAWCYYANTSSNSTTYGKLYNWYAVIDSRGLAPLGYHIPSDAEWTTLTTCLRGEPVAGGKMKETGTVSWLSPNTSATNNSGFTALPGGSRDTRGAFNFIGYTSYLWSSTASGTNYAWYRGLSYSFGIIDSDGKQKNSGFSVRCLKD